MAINKINAVKNFIAVPYNSSAMSQQKKTFNRHNWFLSVLSILQFLTVEFIVTDNYTFIYLFNVNTVKHSSSTW